MINNTFDIEKFSKLQVLCIGDIMLDEYLYGNVTRISPEAPVPVLNYSKIDKMLGGVGNLVANFKALGCQVDVVATIGDDTYGQEITNLVNEKGSHGHFFKLENHPSTVKMRICVGPQQICRIDREEIKELNQELLQEFQKIIVTLIKKADIIILSDYAKGILNITTAQIVIDTCRKENKTVLIDPKGKDYSKYTGATLIKPNLKEFSEITGRNHDPKSKNFEKEFKIDAQYLLKKFNFKSLLVTLGGDGMAFISADNPDRIMRVPTVAKKVFDVSGAGDTTLAGLAASLGIGLSIENSIQIANTLAGIVVGKVGTATASLDELKEALEIKEHFPLNPKKKILTLKEAAKMASLLKKQGKKIGMTNGCFDCCHLGHIQSFIEAKRNCDTLFVAINSDQSVKRYKGENRPIQDEQTRAQLVASFEFVDYVIIFNDDTALPVAEALKPDMIAKEGYTLDQWPEGRYVQSIGGKAIILSKLEGYSTTNIIERMKI